MAEDLDIEDLLEAPFKKEERVSVCVCVLYSFLRRLHRYQYYPY